MQRAGGTSGERRSAAHVAVPPPNADWDSPLTDEELTALALAAAPEQPIDADAVPMAVYLGQHSGPLPDWYMPAAPASVA